MPEQKPAAAADLSLAEAHGIPADDRDGLAELAVQLDAPLPPANVSEGSEESV
jgi:hypothetical protein